MGNTMWDNSLLQGRYVTCEAVSQFGKPEESKKSERMEEERTVWMTRKAMLMREKKEGVTKNTVANLNRGTAIYSLR